MANVNDPVSALAKALNAHVIAQDAMVEEAAKLRPAEPELPSGTTSEVKKVD